MMGEGREGMIFGAEAWVAEESERDFERGRGQKRMKGLRLGLQDFGAGEDGTDLESGTNGAREAMLLRFGECVRGVGNLTTVYS